MSYAASINSVEWYEVDRSFAPSPRTSSSSTVSPLSNMSRSSSRAESVNSKASKRSFFSMSSLRGARDKTRSKSLPNIHSTISAPVLISSTNPLAIVQKDEISCDTLEYCGSQLHEQISQLLADMEDGEDESEEVEEEHQYTTRLSPPPSRTEKPLPPLPTKFQTRVNSSVPAPIKIHSPQPRSHFSMWSEADDTSRASSPTDSTFSRPMSSASFDSTSSTSSTPISASFDYNPYISRVAKTGFQEVDEEILSQLSPASLHDHKQVSALEEYLSDLGLM